MERMNCEIKDREKTIPGLKENRHSNLKGKRLPQLR
jgi:hypothetical protein